MQRTVELEAEPAQSGTNPRNHEGRTIAWLLYSNRQRWIFLVILFLVTTSNYFDYFILSVLLEPIKHDFNLSDTLLGLLSGPGFAIVYAISGIPLALWADRGNRQKLITWALVGWSAMTAACGLAHSFWQLAVARFGVGALEPGAAPPAQSLVVDYCPPERRSMVIALLTMGASAIGYLLGVSLGGYTAATFGWRNSFLIAGAAGLILAVGTRALLKEPRCQLGFPSAQANVESFGQAITGLRRKRSFIFVLIGQSVCTIFAIAASLFIPSFMIRSLHASLLQVSETWGFAVATADFIGGMLGGWLGDILGKRDIRWYPRLAAIASALIIPIYWMALKSERLGSFIAIDFIAELVFSVGLPAAFSAVHAVCGNRRRATAVAALQFCFYLIGFGLGPLIAGALSDAFSSAYGENSLRYSLISMLGFLIPAAAAFWWASRTIHHDREDS